MSAHPPDLVTTEVAVVAPRLVAAGFALAGARTVVVQPGDDGRPDAAGVSRAIDAALRDTTTASVLILVHDTAWQRLAVTARDAWAERTDVLVMGLPPDEPGRTDGHSDQLRRLLGRAVGYEISFVPEGEHR